jgi:hypothetical protein
MKIASVGGEVRVTNGAESHAGEKHPFHRAWPIPRHRSLSRYKPDLLAPRAYDSEAVCRPSWLGAHCDWFGEVADGVRSGTDYDDAEPRRTHTGGGEALTIAGVTVANGGDDLGIYIPMFATSTASDVTIIVGVSAVMTGLWCGVAHSILCWVRPFGVEAIALSRLRLLRWGYAYFGDPAASAFLIITCDATRSR